MKKILLVLAMIAATVFLAQPAIAGEGDTTPTTEANASDTPAKVATAEQSEVDEVVADVPPPGDAVTAPVSKSDEKPAPAAGDDDEEGTPSVRKVTADPPKAAPVAPAMVWVCKYVGQPGVDERLKEGKNPISVSSSSTGGAVVGHYFADAHGRSFVVAIDNGGAAPDLSLCPTAAALTEVTPEEPLVAAPDCLTAGSIELPTTPGVIYAIIPAFAGAGSYSVTAVAAASHVLAPGSVTSFPVTILPQRTGATCETPPDISNDSTDVKICHATSAVENPYNLIPSATAAVANGHDAQHDGPIFPTPGWGDIIEPYTYLGVAYAGQNSTTEGQAIVANGCEPLLSVVPAQPLVSNGCGQDGHVSLPADTESIHYAFTTGDGLTGAWVITATAQPGSYFADGVDPTSDGTVVTPGSCVVNHVVVPLVSIAHTCDDGELPTAVAVDGVSYEFMIGDGLVGPWTILATALPGSVFADDTQFAFSGNAGSGEDCAPPADDEESDADVAMVDDVARMDDLLPDTGGLPLWMLLLSGSMTAAGLLILLSRRPVGHAFVNGRGPAYSLTMPPDAG